MAQAIERQNQLVVEEVNKHDISGGKTNKKTKVTVYLSEEAEKALAELYITRYRKDRKVDRSTIACEAILGLFEKELR